MKPRSTVLWLVVVCLLQFVIVTRALADFAADADSISRPGPKQQVQRSGACGEGWKSRSEQGIRDGERRIDIQTRSDQIPPGISYEAIHSDVRFDPRRRESSTSTISRHKYVEDSPENWKSVTVHHLLSHTSGIPGFTEFPDNLNVSACLPTVEGPKEVQGQATRIFSLARSSSTAFFRVTSSWATSSRRCPGRNTKRW